MLAAQLGVGHLTIIIFSFGCISYLVLTADSFFHVQY